MLEEREMLTGMIIGLWVKMRAVATQGTNAPVATHVRMGSVAVYHHELSTLFPSFRTAARKAALWHSSRV